MDSDNPEVSAMLDLSADLCNSWEESEVEHPAPTAVRQENRQTKPQECN